VIVKPRRNEEAQAHIGLSSHRKKKSFFMFGRAVFMFGSVIFMFGSVIFMFGRAVFMFGRNVFEKRPWLISHD
jgi:hypothetical protein